jgi:excisionase family DNA binding protein
VTKQPDTISLPEFAEAIGVCEKTLRLAFHRGEIPGYQLGNRIVIPRPAFEDFMHGRWSPEYRPHLIVVKEVVHA